MSYLTWLTMGYGIMMSITAARTVWLLGYDEEALKLEHLVLILLWPVILLWLPFDWLYERGRARARADRTLQYIRKEPEEK